MSIPNFSIFKKGTNETYFSKDFQSVLTHIRPILIKSSVSQVYDYAMILCFLFYPIDQSLFKTFVCSSSFWGKIWEHQSSLWLKQFSWKQRKQIFILIYYNVLSSDSCKEFLKENASSNINFPCHLNWWYNKLVEPSYPIVEFDTLKVETINYLLQRYIATSAWWTSRYFNVYF